MKVLVIDNIDSFVYNLVQYAGMSGAEPEVVENTVGDDELTEIADAADAIIISPGPGRPEDAKANNTAIEKYSGKKPILGVCLGHQCIGHVFGARIGYAKTLMHGKTSRIDYVDDTLFKGLPNPFQATRYHSLTIKKEGLPEELIVTAKCPEDDEIMAVKHKDHRTFGVQFHPESINTRNGIRIIQNFLEEAEKDEGT